MYYTDMFTDDELIISQRHAYSGIYVEHNDFSGRAKWGHDVFDPPSNADGHGHSTHVAGESVIQQMLHTIRHIWHARPTTSMISINYMKLCTSALAALYLTSICHDFLEGTILGDKYGLAKKATAIAVRVLNDFGGGSAAYVCNNSMHV